MKILLLGEYSSLHKFLKEGLLENGSCEVTLAANGDGWKNIGGYDTTLFDLKHKSKIGRIVDLYVSPFLKAKQFCNYDVVQFINHRLYTTVLNQPIARQIIKNNSCISLVAAGDDYALAQAYQRHSFEHYVYDYDPYMLTNIYNPRRLKGKFHIRSAVELSKKADVIIPSLYEYSVGYSGYSNLGPIIPFPINISDIKYKPNKVIGKVVFFHGLNREAAKGTKFIKLAMERVKRDYPDEVEIIIDGHMPYDKYLDVLSKTNVVIDQCLTYGYGINTCISLAQGKIVMAPCRKETLSGFGIDESPIIHIEPSVEDIYEKMVFIIKHKNDIPGIGETGRKYVSEVHDFRKIANLYLNAWKSTGKII